MKPPHHENIPIEEEEKMRLFPDCFYCKVKGFMERHDNVHYVIHRTVCPILKFDETYRMREEEENGC